MSFPVYKDIAKCVSDLLSDDFDTKYFLKVKSSGPYGTTLTTTTNYAQDSNKKETLAPKLSLKWAHNSGFTVDKLEVSNDCKYSVETSLVGAVPGLKLEFKGNDCDKSDLSFTYNAPVATVTGDFDLANLSGGSASVTAGSGPVIFGASGEIRKGDKSNDFKYNVGAGLSYTVPKVAFVSVKAEKNLSAYSALFSYNAHKDVTLVGEVGHKSDCDNKFCSNVVVGAVYKCNPDTTIKFKVNTAKGGVAYASVKQQLPGKFSVVGAVEVPKNFNEFKVGVNATLG